jgi:hypothetical protein
MKKNSKFFLMVILFLIYFTLICGCLAIDCINVGLDVYYHGQYPIIQDEGNSTINKIVYKTSQYGTNSTRLIIIADIICENFTDSYWESQWSEEYFCPYPNDEKTGWAWCPPFGGFFEKNPHSYWYVFDKKGHVRTTTSKFIDLTYDPKWIAY